MKYVFGLAGAVVLLGFSLTVLAQDDAAYQEWMKSVSAANASLRKNMDGKMADGVAADAKKLQDVFAQVRGYWEKKNVADAAKFAADAEAGFKEAATLASAGKLDEAGEAVKKAATNCQGCHAAHRERAADGTFHMK